MRAPQRRRSDPLGPNGARFQRTKGVLGGFVAAKQGAQRRSGVARTPWGRTALAVGEPRGIRTPVSDVKSRGPGPLDDGDVLRVPGRNLAEPDRDVYSATHHGTA